MPGGNKLYRFLTKDTKHFLSVVVIKIALSNRDMTQLSRISNSIKQVVGISLRALGKINIIKQVDNLLT